MESTDPQPEVLCRDMLGKAESRKDHVEAQTYVRVDNEMRDCLIEILNKNCLLTLTQLNQELRQRLPRKPRICDRTVARTLEGMLFRVKLARPVPADRNRADARRQGIALGNYRTQLLQQALQRNIGTITAAKCGQWFRFMQTYLPGCLNGEAIEG